MSSNIIVTFSSDSEDGDSCCGGSNSNNGGGDGIKNKKYGDSLSSSSFTAAARAADLQKNKWSLIPEPVFLKILSYLSTGDIVRTGQCCRRWNIIAKDDFLWRKLFQRDFKVSPNIGLKPDSESWYSEYRRLSYNVPMILTDELKDVHAHQVLHVSFSHNGKMFATCSKDGFVIIWNSSYPTTIKYSHDMKKFSWKYTQFSQFNQSDTLLMVSGVHFGSPHSTSGEIAVFSVTGESHLRCRVVNRPYDIFGTWFSDQHLISGDLHWLAHLVSTSVLWLNKANQEVDSEHVPIMNQLYKFYNRNASSIRALLIANCPWLEDDGKENDCKKTSKIKLDSFGNKMQIDDEDDDDGDGTMKSTSNNQPPQCSGNPISHSNLQSSAAFENDGGGGIAASGAGGSSGRLGIGTRNNSIADLIDFPYSQLDVPPRSIQYSDEFRKEYEDSYCESSDDCIDDIDDDDGGGGDNNDDKEIDDDDDDDEDDDDDDEEEDESIVDDLENLCPKYLIFSTGSKTYTPHQIGFKRVKKINFPKKLDPGPSLRERIAAKERERRLQRNNEPRTDPDWLNYDSVSDRFDKVDKLIDLHGHIIGMALSPDHRYLYVNTRPWPKDYVISNALEPPPIAQEIDIHVIDLITLKKVGNMLRAHKAYTPNTECFFIFLDVCHNYVASGAEDLHAYLWDRYYGVCLAKYQHGDVVNSVAFNTRDSEMLVTTSDDYTIKVWRSAEKVAALNAVEIKRATEFRKKN